MKTGNPIDRYIFCDWGLCWGALSHCGGFVKLGRRGHRAQVSVYMLGSVVVVSLILCHLTMHVASCNP
jgi:hypothetical protein